MAARVRSAPAHSSPGDECSRLRTARSTLRSRGDSGAPLLARTVDGDRVIAVDRGGAAFADGSAPILYGDFRGADGDWVRAQLTLP